MQKAKQTIKMPRSFETNKDAAEFFKLVVKAMQCKNVDLDEFILHITLVSQRYGDYADAIRTVKQEGQVIVQQGDKNQDRKIINPAVRIRDDAYKSIVQGLSELGLTYKSKSSIAAVDAQSLDAQMELVRLLNDVPDVGGTDDL
ncbi:P27 family phage terminase small subunit [Aeromonas lacus]